MEDHSHISCQKLMRRFSRSLDSKPPSITLQVAAVCGRGPASRPTCGAVRSAKPLKTLKPAIMEKRYGPCSIPAAVKTVLETVPIARLTHRFRQPSPPPSGLAGPFFFCKKPRSCRGPIQSGGIRGETTHGTVSTPWRKARGAAVRRHERGASSSQPEHRERRKKAEPQAQHEPSFRDAGRTVFSPESRRRARQLAA